MTQPVIPVAPVDEEDRAIGHQWVSPHAVGGKKNPGVWQRQTPGEVSPGSRERPAKSNLLWSSRLVNGPRSNVATCKENRPHPISS